MVSMQELQAQNDGISIIYDGECPFCSSFMSIVRVKKSVGDVRLIDARNEIS